MNTDVYKQIITQTLHLLTRCSFKISSTCFGDITLNCDFIICKLMLKYIKHSSKVNQTKSYFQNSTLNSNVVSQIKRGTQIQTLLKGTFFFYEDSQMPMTVITPLKKKPGISTQIQVSTN